MGRVIKFSIDDVSKEELLSMVDKGYAAMMAVIGIDSLSMDMKLSDVPDLLKEKFLPSRAPQSEWVSVEGFKFVSGETYIVHSKNWRKCIADCVYTEGKYKGTDEEELDGFKHPEDHNGYDWQALDYVDFVMLQQPLPSAPK